MRGGLLLLALLASAAAAAEELRPVPPLTGPVVDDTGILSSSDREALDRFARNVRAQDDGNGVQFGFLLVPSIGFEPIEDFSIRVAEAWKLGTKGVDNGLLFVVATNDHKMRIEVGGGLEGKLPDVLAGRIIDETLRPAFRRGQFGAGLLAGAGQAISIIQGGAAAMPPARRRPDGGQLPALVWAIFILIFLVSRILGPHRRGGVWIGGGGSWGGGSSGGGWSGGGGGFSGGGASGGW